MIVIAANTDAAASLGAAARRMVEREEKRRELARTSSRDISTPERINQILGKLIAPTVPITDRQTPKTLKM